MSDTLTVYGWTATDLRWRQQAACIGFVDTFFPDRPDRYSRAAAIRICDSCPVISECNDYANQTGEKMAVWGGIHRPNLFRL